MEKKTNRKRMKDAPSKNEKKDSRVVSRIRPAVGTGSTTKKALSEGEQRNPPISISDIQIDPDTARQAIILSEIIGPPAAKRRRSRR
jgi:hypothetical protein